MFERLRRECYERFRQATVTAGKQARAEAVKALRDQVYAAWYPDPTAADYVEASTFKAAWHKLEERLVRDMILAGQRADGRDNVTLRHIDCQVDVLPRVHGSALFTRGETQALVTVM